MEKIEQLKQTQKEKEQFIFGIVLAIVTGFIVNFWSNIFYDFFITNESKHLNSPLVSTLIFTTILLQAFFDFYLKDKFEDGPYKKTFWKRFLDFVINKHWSGRMGNTINRYVLWFFKLSLWVVFIISAKESRAYWLLVLVLIFILVKEIYKKLKLTKNK